MLFYRSVPSVAIPDWHLRACYRLARWRALFLVMSRQKGKTHMLLMISQPIVFIHATLDPLRGLQEHFAFGNGEAWLMTTPHFVLGGGQGGYRRGKRAKSYG